MSGEAGASIQGERYSIFLGSGRIVSVAIPPNGDGASVRDYFARANLPYRRWLERARPGLEALFAQLVAEGLPLVAHDARCEEIDGVVIEEPDAKADHFRRHSHGLPCPVHLRGGRLMPGGRSLNLRLVVSARVRRAQLDPIVERVVAVLRETEAEPADPTPALAPARPPSLAARLWAWLRGD